MPRSRRIRRGRSSRSRGKRRRLRSPYRCMVMALFTWTEWADALRGGNPCGAFSGRSGYGRDTYYVHWLAALERLVVAKGAATTNPSRIAGTHGIAPPGQRHTDADHARRGSCTAWPRELSALSAWRAMRAGDLAAVMDIAAVVHPELPEKVEVFAERLSLFPRGLFRARRRERGRGLCRGPSAGARCPSRISTA